MGQDQSRDIMKRGWILKKEREKTKQKKRHSVLFFAKCKKLLGHFEGDEINKFIYIISFSSQSLGGT